MKCFYHPNESAVGVCKACSKGLCPDCAADLGHGVACKNKHEQRAEEIESLVSKNILAMKNLKNSPLNAVFFFGFMGSVLVGFGLFSQEKINWTLMFIAASFLLVALLAFIQSRAACREK